MRIHHLNLGSLRSIPPVGGGPEEAAVCHGLLIETDADGLVLVETGLGTADLRHPAESLGADWIGWVQPALRGTETALSQVSALGFAPADVRHILLTHLHRDHTGGLPDFPTARVHLLAAEHRALTDPAAEHHRHTLDHFMPAHRAHRPLLTPAQEPADWFGVPGVVRPAGLAEPDLLLVPLPGHSAGHAGVAVRGADGGWLLHAGDAYMYHGELDATPPVPHPVFEQVQQGVQLDLAARLATRDLLRTLSREHGVRVFSAHDPWEFARFTADAS